MRIGINCGHTVQGTVGCGASGYLIESDETRNIGKKLMSMLREYGYEVVDCTSDYALSVSDNLKEICNIANSNNLDLFYSIHLNAGGGTGTEVLTYGCKDTANASRILNCMKDIGFRNRGIKNGSNLYVVRHTNAPAALIETCFVDNKDDYYQYNSLGSDRVAAAIFEGITGTAYKNKEEELTMSQYTELCSKIDDLQNELAKVTNYSSPKYNKNDETMPSWCRTSISKLQECGALKGDEDGNLNLSEADIRLYTILDRLNVYDDVKLYDYEDSVPEYAKPTIHRLINDGVIKGDSEGKLGLTIQSIRMLVYLDRCGVFN